MEVSSLSAELLPEIRRCTPRTTRQEPIMSDQNRRDFLKQAAAGGLLAALSAGIINGGNPASAGHGDRLASRKRRSQSGTQAAPAPSANGRIRIALAGLNGRGVAHLHEFCRMKNVEIAYLVDPDTRLFASRSDMIKQLAGNTPKCVQDLRTILDDKDLDVVSIAAPNHWHSLLAIWACQAGKDVYVEKPCSHNVYEGRKLVEAARKYDRIVQHGTQSRSSATWAKQVAAVRSGKYGRLLVSYGYASKTRRSIGVQSPKQPPKELDFDLWLGPAPQQAYHENLVHYNWHWFWDFGNGEIGNQGAHQMDVARWAMPDGAVPKTVISLGGRFGYTDQGQTPNTQLSVIDFGGPKIVFEDRGLVTGKTSKVTNEFYTDEGVIKDGQFFPKGKKEGEPLAEVEYTLHPHGPFGNFIDCVRSRKREDLNAEILEGHLSATLCHLANVSYQLGGDARFDKKSETLGDDRTVGEAFESMKRHLVKAAKLNLADATYRLGRKLVYDAAAEQFISDADANQRLRGPRRKPYVIPENI
jgi:predicted dehydrogenase